MTVEESKDLKKGTRVYWRGDAADSGIIMREIQGKPTNAHTVQRQS
jgi:hypothetical protein